MAPFQEFPHSQCNEFIIFEIEAEDEKEFVSISLCDYFGKYWTEGSQFLLPPSSYFWELNLQFERGNFSISGPRDVRRVALFLPP
jgi:hypothetical protein